MKINIDKILSKLDALSIYWAFGPRGIGQTYALKAGSDSAGSLVLAHNKAHATALAGRNGLTLDDLPEKIQGIRKPLLADHYVMGILLHDAAYAIRELQSELAEEKKRTTR